MLKTKRKVQADDKEAQNHQINQGTDIQAKMQITIAIDILCMDIAHLDWWVRKSSVSMWWENFTICK